MSRLLFTVADLIQDLINSAVIEKVGLVLFKLRKAYTNLVLQGKDQCTDHVISLTTIWNSKKLNF